MRSKLGVLAVAVLMAGAALSILADGDTRPATAAEKAFYGKVYGALAGLVPVCPAGWSSADRSKPEPPTAVPGSRPHPIEVEVKAACRDTVRLQAAQMKQMNAVQTGGTILDDPKFKALMAKQQALATQLGAAAQKSDTAAMQRIQKEMDPIGKEMKTLSEAYEKKTNTAMRTNQARDAEVAVEISGNRFYEYLSGAVTQEAPVAGLPTYRVEPSDRGGGQIEDGTTWTFLGAWRTTQESGAVRFQSDEKPGPSTTLQTVVVQVKGDKARARAILEKMDWAPVKAIMK